MQNGNILAQIREGMKVYDRMDNEIGTVDRVKMSDDNPATEEAEAVTADEPPRRKDTFLDALADVFSADGLPEVVRERLLQQGFIRIDAKGLFAADRYVLPDQIMSVSGEGVTLKVSKDELVKRA